MAIYVFREGITRGHERLGTSEDSILAPGVSKHNSGNSFKVEQQSSTSLVVRKGVAYIPWRDGIHNTALYLMEMDQDYVISVPYVSGTMFWSVIAWVDLNQTPDAEGTNVGKISLVQGTSTNVPTWSQIGGATGGDYQPTLILAHFKTVDGFITDIVDARKWVSGFDADPAINSLLTHRENFIPNSDFSFGRLAWWCSDWTKAFIDRKAQHVLLANTAGNTLRFINRWIYGDNDGGDKRLRLGAPVVWSGRVHRYLGNQKVELIVRYLSNANNWVEIKRQTLYMEGEEDHSARWFAVHFEIPTEAHQWIELEIAISGGTVDSSVYTERWQLERGYVPSLWQPRPWGWEPLHNIVLPYGTNPAQNTYEFEITQHGGKQVFGWSAWAGVLKNNNDGTDNWLHIQLRGARDDLNMYDVAGQYAYVGQGWIKVAHSAAVAREVSPVAKYAQILFSHTGANNVTIVVLTGLLKFI